MTRNAEAGFLERPAAVMTVVSSGTGLITSMVDPSLAHRPIQTITLAATNVVGWGLVAHANRRAGRREGMARSSDRESRTDGALRQGRDRRGNEPRRRFSGFRAR